jgi:hypothetical protein
MSVKYLADGGKSKTELQSNDKIQKPQEIVSLKKSQPETKSECKADTPYLKNLAFIIIIVYLLYKLQKERRIRTGANENAV